MTIHDKTVTTKQATKTIISPAIISNFEHVSI